MHKKSKRRKRHKFEIVYVAFGKTIHEIYKAPRNLPYSYADCFIRKRVDNLSMDEFHVEKVIRSFY